MSTAYNIHLMNYTRSEMERVRDEQQAEYHVEPTEPEIYWHIYRAAKRGDGWVFLRDAHASVFASSSMRPFELAAMGCCIVSNPYEGIKTWFDVGNELIVVNSADEAIAAYAELLRDEGRCRAMGEAARNRVLECHTHRDRAMQIAKFVQGG